MAALRAAAPHAGEAGVQVATAGELADHIANDGPPEAVTFFLPVGTNVLELREVPSDFRLRATSRRR